jgi:uncharacterized protein (DUF1697 family)
MSTTWVALLRGINVGGRNRILMADLRERFEAAGYRDVRTYIQSGNVIFGSVEPDRETLRRAIETMLGQAFDYAATVELRDGAELRAVVRAAPEGFGSDKDTYLDDVLFLMPPLEPDEAVGALTIRDGVDTVWTGPGVLYSRRLKARASRSGLSKIAAHPFYQRMTIRNWNTTRKLYALMTEA